MVVVEVASSVSSPSSSPESLSPSSPSSSPESSEVMVAVVLELDTVHLPVLDLRFSRTGEATVDATDLTILATERWCGLTCLTCEPEARRLGLAETETEESARKRAVTVVKRIFER